MGKKLLIVESGHKASAIGKFLGAEWTVKASVGHIRELMDTKKIPEAKKDKYGKYSIDTTTWDALFQVSAGKTQLVSELKKLAAAADEVYLGTDLDREGEAIAWHLAQLLGTKKPTYRVGWREITKKAVDEGLKKKGQINQQEVDAAIARQLYDRVFGFSISPVLWRTIQRGASGGRVQSPALRLIVNREKERLAFVKAEYMSVTGDFGVGSPASNLSAVLQTFGTRKIATGGSFGSDGKVKEGHLIITEDVWKKMSPMLKEYTYEISDVSTKPYSRKPPAPYTTSSFQQDVGTRLRMSSKQIMSMAQMLYDNGFSSYPRTDSVTLSDEAIKASRAEVVKLFGKGELPATANVYKSKAKNAQEGHEALRPTTDDKGDFRSPASIKTQLDRLNKDAHSVYTAIYNRTVASQMKDAKGITTTVKISSMGTAADRTATFATSATVFTELGWTALTKPLNEDGEEANSLESKVDKGDSAKLKKLSTKTHSTTPPARYTEPQLVAVLEEKGIGRPSTYASIVTVNQTRGYVQKKGQQMFPTFTGMKVAQYLEANIPDFVSYDATAQMEEELDKIEDGSLKRNTFLDKEWKGVQKDVLPLSENIDWTEINKIGTISLHNGYVVTVNSFGAWLEDMSVPADPTTGRRKGAKLSDDENVSSIDFTDPEVCKKLYEAGSKKVEVKELGELSGGAYAGWTVVARDGKFGAYAQATPPETTAKSSKLTPINHTLPEGLTLDKVTLADVAPLFDEIKLPRWSPDKKWLVGIGKKGAYMGMKRTLKGKPVFKGLDEQYDPRTISFADVKKMWDEDEANQKAKPAPAKSKAKPAARKTPVKKKA